MSSSDWTCFRVERDGRVAQVAMCRPEKRNSMIPAFWRELPEVIRSLDGAVRAIVLSADGPHYTAGLDLAMFAGIGAQAEGLQRPLGFMQMLELLQDAFTAAERCRVPVIAAVQGGCIGGGVDLVTACDLRYATADAFFTIQETNLAMMADVGTFPRLCHLLPEGVVRELAYTGRKFSAEEAQRFGFVNDVLPDHDALLDRTMSVAAEIAKKAPVAVHGCKNIITYARDHSTAETLDYVRLWNASMLSIPEIMEAIQARAEKREGNFTELPPLLEDLEEA
ncbi:MAG: crotonase/enoyl-CoA hydratase family protein [Myxococcota bacterium]